MSQWPSTCLCRYQRLQFHQYLPRVYVGTNSLFNVTETFHVSLQYKSTRYNFLQLEFDLHTWSRKKLPTPTPPSPHETFLPRPTAIDMLKTLLPTPSHISCNWMVHKKPKQSQKPLNIARLPPTPPSLTVKSYTWRCSSVSWQYVSGYNVMSVAILVTL